MKDDPTTYDQVPYSINAYPLTHPCHVATVARLFGQEPADPTKARVLELGCGHGGNILPMAEQLPESSFVAVDLSETQINNARTIAKAAQLENIEFHHKDLSTIDKDFGSFDYIIVHGVYSWIPDSAKDHLLRICKENLNPNGIAFVSYNTYPGWRFKESIRDMLLIHTERFEKPIDILKNAKGLLNFLEAATKQQDTPYAKFLKQELERLKAAEDTYLFHEMLEENNHPIYFRDFFKKVTEKGLAYLGDSSTKTMVTMGLDKETRETLEKATKDIITREQYLDFLRNRTFRQSLLCHNDNQINRAIQAKPFKDFVYRSVLTNKTGINLDDGIPVEFTTRNEVRITVRRSLEKAVLYELQKSNPIYLKYDDLIERARHTLESVISDQEFESQEKGLYVNLFNLYQIDGLTMLSYSPNFVDYVSERPLVSRLGRAQAELGIRLISRTHIGIKMDNFHNQVVTMLDGENSVDDIIKRLVEATGPNKLKVEQEGKEIDDPETLEKIYSGKVNKLLQILAANALLIA